MNYHVFKIIGFLYVMTDNNCITQFSCIDRLYCPRDKL